MSKRIRTLVIGGAVLVVLAGLTVALLLWPAKEEEVLVESSSSTAITIASIESDQLQSAVIRNEEDEYTIELVGEKLWRIKDIQDFTANEGRYASTRNDLTTVTAMEIIEESCTDLSKYGLDSPAQEVNASFKDGTSYHIALGDVSPDGSRRYALRLDETNNTVYGLSSTALGSASLTRYDYLDTTIVRGITAEDGSAVQPVLNGVTITGNYLDTPIVIEEMTANDTDLVSNMDALKMTSPVKSLLDMDWITKSISPLVGLTASAVVKANPTAEDLTAYGLAQPYMTIDLKYEKTSSCKLLIGAGTDAEGNPAKFAKDIVSYYVMKDGTDLVYAVAKESLPCAGAQPKDVLSTLITLPNIAIVDKVEVLLDGTNHVLEIIQTPNEDPEKADDPNQNKYTFRLDGKEVKDDISRKFYQVLLGTSIQDVNTAKPTGSPTLTISYYQNTGRVDKVEFYVESDLTTIVALNGDASYIGRSGMVEKVRKELVNLQNGEMIDPDF